MRYHGQYPHLQGMDKYRHVQTKEAKKPPEGVGKTVCGTLQPFEEDSPSVLLPYLTGILWGHRPLAVPGMPQPWESTLRPGNPPGWPAAGWVWQSRGRVWVCTAARGSITCRDPSCCKLLSHSLAPKSHPYRVLRHSCLRPVCWGHERLASHDAVSFTLEEIISETFWVSIITGMVIPDSRAGDRQLLTGRYSQLFPYYKFEMECSPLCSVGWWSELSSLTVQPMCTGLGICGAPLCASLQLPFCGAKPTPSSNKQLFKESWNKTTREKHQGKQQVATEALREMNPLTTTSR